jgi:zinc D-Ala-D-Ala carboxypeptidase
MSRYLLFSIPLFILLGVAACGTSPAQERSENNTSVNSDTDSTAILIQPETLMQVTRAELLGQIQPASHADFVKIESRFTSKQGIYLRREAYESFTRMAESATNDGITLRILSATRNFYDQKKIWEDKWNGIVAVGGKNLATSVNDPVTRALAILTYSSMPGTSRHHWGTDIDMNSLEPAFFNSGEGKKIYDWLCTNGPTFGWCQPYTAKGDLRPNGYNEEKWHWSYLPISKNYLTTYSDSVSYANLNGFAGWETAEKIDVIEKYVKGVGCK